jgi:hypothetical protein
MPKSFVVMKYNYIVFIIIAVGCRTPKTYTVPNSVSDKISTKHSNFNDNLSGEWELTSMPR